MLLWAQRLSFLSSPLGVSPNMGLIERNPKRYRGIQALGSHSQGNPGQLVAVLAHQAAHALPLGADHQG